MGDIQTVLNETGEGLGDLFDGIAVPLGTLLIVVMVASAIGAILYGVAKAITSRT